MPSKTPRVDSDFPGGNIVVERQEGATFFIRPDLRDTTSPWFYWYFRVTQAAGQRLVFRFTQPNCLTAQGACVSDDGGQRWRWLGEQQPDGFDYQVPETASEVRFALAFPYTESHLGAWLTEWADHPALHVTTLCPSEQGRPVELIRIGENQTAGRAAVVIARQHACETLGSYVLEGLMRALLADDEPGRWLRREIDWLIVPFMDKDGVEAGDQGKNRAPRDHNRDWDSQNRYATVRALRERLPRWGRGRCQIALDLHCPWVRGDSSHTAFLVGSRHEQVWQQQQRFSEHLQRVQRGPVVYDMADNLPFGQRWNVGSSLGTCFSHWAAEELAAPLSSTVEFPYAVVRGRTVDPASARAFGADLARALRQYAPEAPLPLAQK